LINLKSDIIHITTPPESHYLIGKTCIENNVNILVEKPFTTKYEDTEKLINLAKKKDLKVTVGHNIQFSTAARRMRSMIKNGILGGPPIHIESIWCHEHSTEYITDKNHWIRKLPGKIVHDLISHGIGFIGEYMNCLDPDVITKAFVSPYIQKIKEESLIDEIRATVYDRKNLTGTYIFSSQIKPIIKQVRVYGPKNTIVMDYEQQTVVKHVQNFKHYLNHFIPALINAKQYAGNFIYNTKKFLRNQHYFEGGRKYLIEKFYDAIRNNKSLPISYREILTTYSIIDRIFDTFKK
jgi:predicted dehydrogenase